MSDQKRVYSKTPVLRFSEILLIIGISAAASAIFHRYCPAIELGYPVIAFTGAMLFLVPWIGDRLVQRRGGALIPREARTRRYLDQLGPLAFRLPGAAPPRSRRGHHRGLFRDMA